MTVFNGTGDDDKFVGRGGDDSFYNFGYGDDTAIGGGGDDYVETDWHLAPGDVIDGGAGFDKVYADFGYSKMSLALTGQEISNVEQFYIFSNYQGELRFTLSDTVATPDLKGGAFEVLTGDDAQNLIKVDASAETDTPIHFRGGYNVDFSGGAMDDTFDFTNGYGEAVGAGNGGDDLFRFSQGSFSGNTGVDGGDGFDTVRIEGEEATLDIVLRAQNLVNVETLWLESAQRIVFSDGNVAPKHILTVDGSSAVKGMTLDGSHETRGGFDLIGGAGDDKLTGGGGRDTLDGGAGKDVLAGGARGDVFIIRELSTTGAPTILDLTRQDLVDLRDIDANANLDGDQRFKLVEAFTGRAGQAVLSYDAAHDMTTLALDVDGDRAADGLIRLAGDEMDFKHFML